MSNFNNSFTTSTSIRWGSTELKESFYLAQSVNIPGISFNNPQLGARFGARPRVSGDSLEYSSLNIEIIIDNNFSVYDEIFQSLLETIDPETGKFTNNKVFDLWIELYDNNSKKSMIKFWIYNCRIQSVGDVQFDVRDGEDNNITCMLILDFDYIKKEN